MTNADAATMKQVLAALPAPVLGFCRSGMRAATLWALAEAENGDPNAIIGAAKAAGYDLADLRPTLKRRAGGARS